MPNEATKNSDILSEMHINFTYNKERDVWCLLNKGKSSNNDPNPTKVYELLVAECGENPTDQATSNFIDTYLVKNNISTVVYAKKYSEEWSLVADEYYRRAEGVFGVPLHQDITACLTINNRYPYSIADNLFYVPVPRDTVRKTVMHELWHFYTWYGLGVDQESAMGKQKYNDLKEALTVLLNEECGDLMPEGVFDEGYPQHQEQRKEIARLWNETKDIQSIWNKLGNRANLLGEVQ
jgi:hypothetical protein